MTGCAYNAKCKCTTPPRRPVTAVTAGARTDPQMIRLGLQRAVSSQRSRRCRGPPRRRRPVLELSTSSPSRADGDALAFRACPAPRSPSPCHHPTHPLSCPRYCLGPTHYCVRPPLATLSTTSACAHVAPPLSWLGSCSGLHHSLGGAKGVFRLPRDGAEAVEEHHVLVGRLVAPLIWEGDSRHFRSR